MKKILTIFLILTLALSLCACELTSTLTDSELGGKGEEQPRETMLQGLSLVYFDDKGEHPLLDTSVGNQQIHTVVYEPAFTFDEQMNIMYGCAMEVTVSGKKITIVPDTGRHFSDGTRLNATLMAKSFQFVLEHAASPYHRQLSVVESVSTQGGNVILTLVREDKTALYCLDIPIVYEKDGKYYGCGNYMLGKYQDEPALVKSPHAQTQPKSEPIVLLDPADETALAGMFNSGVLDVLPEALMASGQLSLSREYKSREYLTNTMLYVGVNARRDDLNNAMRRALSALIPRTDILESVLMGKGVATRYPFYPYWPSLPKETVESAEKSRLFELFTAAGLHAENGELFTADGKRPSFELLVCDNNKTHAAAAEKIRTAAVSVGMDITVVTVGEETFLNRLRNGNFELYIARYQVGKNMDPTALYATDGAYNYGNVSLPSLDKAFDELGSGKITTESYLTQFDRECPVLPIAFIKDSLYYTEGVTIAGKISQSDPFGTLELWNIE